jgi:hypothetical protein
MRQAGPRHGPYLARESGTGLEIIRSRKTRMAVNLERNDSSGGFLVLCFQGPGVPESIAPRSSVVYPTPRFGSNGDEVHQGSGVNECFRPDESDEKSAHPRAKTDAF